MKNIIGKIAIFIILISLSVNVYADNFYSWLEDNNMVVTPENKDELINTYGLTGITDGTVLLNYVVMGVPGSTPADSRDLSLSSSQVGITYVDFYKSTNNPEYKRRAVLIADNVINNKIVRGKFTLWGENENLTFIYPQTNMQDDGHGGKIWNHDSGYIELYPIDSLMNVKLLLDVYEITNDDNYKNTALEVLDSWIYIQGLFSGVFCGEGAGALPYIVYRESDDDTFRLTWTAPNDIAYSLYESSQKAYEITNDNKYKTFQDNYFNFLIKSLSSENGTFTINKNGNNYILPYEYTLANESDEGGTCTATLYGVNQKNQPPYNYDSTNDITTDQLFYTILGLMKYDKNNYYSKEFYKSLKAISLNGESFYGEYSITGEKGSYQVEEESVNSGFYIEMLKIYDASNEEINTVVKALLREQEHSTHPAVNKAWKWDFGDKYGDEDNIESLATAVILKSLVGFVTEEGVNTLEPVNNPPETPDPPVDPNVPGEQTNPENTSEDTNQNQSESHPVNPMTGDDTNTQSPNESINNNKISENKTVNNPKTGDSIELLLITSIFIFMYFYSRKLHIKKRW